MHVRRNGKAMLMTEGLLCVNYSDMKHYTSTFEKVGDNEYACSACGTVHTVKEPVLVHDERGRLKMQVEVEEKVEEPKRAVKIAESHFTLEGK